MQETRLTSKLMQHMSLIVRIANNRQDFGKYTNAVVKPDKSMLRLCPTRTLTREHHLTHVLLSWMQVTSIAMHACAGTPPPHHSGTTVKHACMRTTLERITHTRMLNGRKEEVWFSCCWKADRRDEKRALTLENQFACMFDGTHPPLSPELGGACLRPFFPSSPSLASS